jgi:hypothetical protein
MQEGFNLFDESRDGLVAHNDMTSPQGLLVLLGFSAMAPEPSVQKGVENDMQ